MPTFDHDYFRGADARRNAPLAGANGASVLGDRYDLEAATAVEREHHECAERHSER